MAVNYGKEKGERERERESERERERERAQASEFKERTFKELKDKKLDERKNQSKTKKRGFYSFDLQKYKHKSFLSVRNVCFE